MSNKRTTSTYKSSVDKMEHQSDPKDVLKIRYENINLLQKLEDFRRVSIKKIYELYVEYR